MNSPPDAAYAAVRDTDPDVLDADALDRYTRHVSELKAWCDARQVRATRRQRELADVGRAADPTSSLAHHGRTSSRDARAAAEREIVCTTMPGFEAALADGTIVAGHVDAIARATGSLDDECRAEFAGEADSLLVAAGSCGVDTFAKHCRDLARGIRARANNRSDVDELERQRQQSKISRWVDDRTGMHHTHIECDPVTDRRIWAAVQQARRRLRNRSASPRSTGPTPSWDRLTVDALVDAVTSDGGTDAGGIVVLVDLTTLADGRRAATVCETDSGAPVPVELVRRMACEADIIPVVR